MNVERPLEMSILPARLRSDFGSKIPEAPSGPPEQREMQPTIQAYGDRSKPDDAEESKTGGT